MSTARDLRDHPTKAGMLVHAGGERLSEQGWPSHIAAHKADAGFVARRLDAKHQATLNTHSGAEAFVSD